MKAGTKEQKERENRKVVSEMKKDREKEIISDGKRKDVREREIFEIDRGIKEERQRKLMRR